MEIFTNICIFLFGLLVCYRLNQIEKHLYEARPEDRPEDYRAFRTPPGK